MRRAFLVVSTCLLPVLLVAQSGANVITTFAGTTWTFPPTPIPAVQAPLGAPLFPLGTVVLDASGNIYLTDGINNLVMRVSPAGTLTVVAGNGVAGFSGDGGPAINAALSAPTALALDSAGNLFVADFGNFRVRKISPDGIITTVAGNGNFDFSGDGGPATAAGLSPSSIALDSAGNLYIGDMQNVRVRKVLSSGVITTIAGNGADGFAGDGGPARNAQIRAANGLAFDAAGSLYIADLSRVRKVTPDGVITTFAGNGTFQAPEPNVEQPATSTLLGSAVGLAFDTTGNLFLTDSEFGVVLKVTPAGVLTRVAGAFTGLGFAGDGGPAVKASFENPGGIAVDPAGNLYLIDGRNARLRKIDTSGIVNTIAGNGGYRFAGDGGPVATASLYTPAGLTFDSAGNLYVADSGSHRVRKITRAGIIQTVAGNGAFYYPTEGAPANTTPISTPSGIVTDSAGNLYIADQAYVYRVSPDGAIHYFAGSGFSDHDGEGGPATEAYIGQPVALAIDAARNVYIAGLSNNKVRKVSPNGIITTVAGNGTFEYPGDGVPAIKAGIHPQGLAVDATGNLYIADFAHARVFQVSPAGVITTVAGNGQIVGPGGSRDGVKATQTPLYGPSDVAVDAVGNLYISDYYAIRKVSGGIITTIAGNGTQGFSGDGAPATQAALNRPAGLAIDSAGNLFFSDSGNDRIREVLAARPTVQLSAASLNFAGQSSGAPSPAQRLAISGSIPGVLFSVSTSAPWLSVSSPTGAAPRLLDVIADPSHLSPGTYQATLTISARDASPNSLTVAVSFTVSAATAPSLSIDVPSLTFSFPRSGSAQSQRLTVSNSGGGTLSFTASAVTAPAGGGWLSVSPVSGQATPGTPAPLTVTADPAGLPPGTYNGVIGISSSAGAQSVNVVMTISSLDQAILLSQRGLSFTSVVGGGVVPPQTFSIVNIGSGPVSWSVSTSTLGGQNWLQATPASGSTAVGTQATTLITVSVNPAGLVPGAYYGLVRVDAPGAANTPQVVTAFLQVLPAGTDVAPIVQPSSLVFTVAAGAQSPGSQTAIVYNSAAAVKNFRSTNDSAAVVVAPTDAILDPQHPVPIVVQPFTTGLAPGTYSSTLTLQFNDGRVSRLNITVIVSGGGISPKRPGQLDPTCAPTKLLPALTTLPDSFEISAGWPVALSAVVKDDCGTALTSGSVTVGFSNGDLPVTLQPLADGRWEGTWPNRTTAGSNITLKLHAENPQLKIAGEQQVAGGLQSQQQPPVFDLANVTAAFDGPPYAPVAPGTVIVLKGDRLAESTAAQDSPPLATQLVDTQVTMAGVKLPLYYVSQTQINAVVPYSIVANAPQYLLVQRGLTYSIPLLVNVAAAAPDLLSAIVDYPADGTASFYVSAASPAHAGDTLVVYATGLGAVTPAVADGAAPPAATQTNNAVQLRIGGVPANVVYAGLAPGIPGLYQVNAVVPTGVAAGDAVPVAISAAGQISQVTIAIR